MVYKYQRRGKRAGAKLKAKQAEKNGAAGTSADGENLTGKAVKTDEATSSELDTTQDLDDSNMEEDAREGQKEDGKENGGKKEDAGSDKRIVPLMDVDVPRITINEIPLFSLEKMRGKT